MRRGDAAGAVQGGGGSRSGGGGVQVAAAGSGGGGDGGRAQGKRKRAGEEDGDGFDKGVDEDDDDEEEDDSQEIDAAGEHDDLDDSDWGEGKKNTKSKGKASRQKQPQNPGMDALKEGVKGGGGSVTGGSPRGEKKKENTEVALRWMRPKAQAAHVSSGNVSRKQPLGKAVSSRQAEAMGKAAIDWPGDGKKFLSLKALFRLY